MMDDDVRGQRVFGQCFGQCRVKHVRGRVNMRRDAVSG
jgi:hypothetical protein